MSQAKIDNSKLAEKINIRLLALEMAGADKHVKVLDLFHGTGKLWSIIKKMSPQKIDVLGIDIVDIDDVDVVANNMQILESIHLCQFDIIDADAYGSPYNQIKAIADKKYYGIIVYTNIRVGFGAVPKKMVLEAGYSEEMYEAVPTMFGKIGERLFYNWLYMSNVRMLHRYKTGRKEYGVFSLANQRPKEGERC